VTHRVTPPVPTPGVATDDAVKHVVRPCTPPTSVGGVFFGATRSAGVETVWRRKL
jgi:hypothetical protein